MGKALTVRDQLKKMAAEQAEAARPSGSTVSVKGGQLAYQGNPIPDNKLPCIVLSNVYENAFYKDAYDPDNPKSPDCFALSITGEEMVPHKNSDKPQADACAGCPNAKWGSAPGNSRGKACKNVRRLALIPADSPEKGIIAAEVAIIKLPVMSVKNWDNYVRSSTARTNLPTLANVTQISTVPDPKSQYRVVFEHLQEVDIDVEGVLDQLIGKAEEANDVALLPYEVQ